MSRGPTPCTDYELFVVCRMRITRMIANFVDSRRYHHPLSFTLFWAGFLCKEGIIRGVRRGIRLDICLESELHFGKRAWSYLTIVL